MAKQKKSTEQEPVINDKLAAYNALKLKHKGLGVSKEVRPVLPTDCLQTASTQFNLMTNDGGIRPGSIVESWGQYGTMKTSLALQTARMAQLWKPDLSVAYYDPEDSLDLYIAETQFNIDRVPFEDGRPRFDYWPDCDDDVPTLEELLNRIYDICASGIYSFVVLDSVAACMTLWDKEQDSITDAKVGGPSIPMSKGMKRLKSVCRRTGTILWCINQVRMQSIQTPRGPMMSEGPGGGNALRFAASHRFKLSWAEKDTEGTDSRLRVYSDKVKYGRSWKTIEIPMTLGEGVNEYADLVIAAEAAGVIEKSGSWYSYEGERLGQGRDNVAAVLKEMPLLKEKIKTEVYQRVLTKQETYDTIEETDLNG